MQIAMENKKDKIGTLSQLLFHMFFFPEFGKQRLEHPKYKVSLLYISS
jgi:hypothetical protein